MESFPSITGKRMRWDQVNWWIFICVIIMQLCIIILFAEKGIGLVALITLGFVGFVYTAFSVEKLFFVICFYIIVFEEPGYLVYFPGISIFYSKFISGLLLAIMILYWFIYVIHNKIRYEIKSLDKTIIVFLILSSISMIHGFMNGYDKGNILEDYIPFIFFVSYFMVLYSPMNKYWKYLYDFFLFCSGIVSLQFIYAIFQLKGLILLPRVVSTHIHLAQFALPYLGLSFIYSENRIRKWLSVLIAPFILVAVFISQQRALWLSVFITGVILIVLFISKNRRQIIIHKKRLLVYIFIALIAIAGGISL